MTRDEIFFRAVGYALGVVVFYWIRLILLGGRKR